MALHQTTVEGRFGGGALFKPKASPQNPNKLEHTCLTIFETARESEKVEKIINAAIKDEWGDRPPAGLQVWGPRDGDDPEYSATFGKEFINPKSKTDKPPKLFKVIDGTVTSVSPEDSGIYSGCYVAVSIHAYTYKGDRAKGVKPGVSLSLRGVIFLRDGEPLGDHVDADAEFGDYLTESDDEFMNEIAAA